MLSNVDFAAVTACGECEAFACEWLVQKVVWRPNVVEELRELADLYYKQTEENRQ